MVRFRKISFNQIRSLNISRILIATFHTFFYHTSLHGFKYLVSPKLTLIKKFIWVLVQIAAVSSSVYVLLVAWSNFTDNPTITTLYSQSYSISEVPFPAIGICSNNKLSKKSVLEYAKELSEKIPMFDENWFFERLRYLGRLLDFDVDGKDEFVYLQEMLDQFDTKNGIFDTVNKMKRLAVKCEDILISCFIGGKSVNCSTSFKLHRSYEGHCCVFNSERNGENPIKITEVGPEQGLLLLLNTSTEDYYYAYRNTPGFSLHIFGAANFADAGTGGFVQQLIEGQREFFIQLSSTTILADDGIEKYSVEKRQCLFKHEHPEEFDGHYSYTDCLLACKIRSIIALCKCTPYFLPRDFNDTVSDGLICTMSDLECLNRYKNTWRTYKPITDDIEGLERELEDSLNCPMCLPLCSSTQYSSKTGFSIIATDNKTRPRFGIVKNVSNLKDIAIVRIYNPKQYTLLYRTDEVNTWYEILSNFGGLLGIFIGLGILSIVEFVYFFTFKLYRIFIADIAGHTIAEDGTPQTPPDQEPPSYKQIEMELMRGSDFARNRPVQKPPQYRNLGLQRFE